LDGIKTAAVKSLAATSTPTKQSKLLSEEGVESVEGVEGAMRISSSQIEGRIAKPKQIKKKSARLSGLRRFS
jgi:hypothetical protein